MSTPAPTSTAPDAAVRARVNAIVLAAERMWEQQRPGQPFPRALKMQQAMQMVLAARATAAAPAPALQVVPQNALLSGVSSAAAPGLSAHTAAAKTLGSGVISSITGVFAPASPPVQSGGATGAAPATAAAATAPVAAQVAAVAPPQNSGDPTTTPGTPAVPTPDQVQPPAGNHDGSQWVGSAIEQALDDSQRRLWGSPGLYFQVQNYGANGVNFWPDRNNGQTGDAALALVKTFRAAQSAVAQYRAFLEIYYHAVYVPYLIYFLQRVRGTNSFTTPPTSPNAIGFSAKAQEQWNFQSFGGLVDPNNFGTAPATQAEYDELHQRGPFDFLCASQLWSDVGSSNVVQTGGKPYSYAHPYLPGGSNLTAFNDNYFRGGFSTETKRDADGDLRDFYSMLVSIPSDEAVLAEIGGLAAVRQNYAPQDPHATPSAFSATSCGLVKSWRDSVAILQALTPHNLTNDGAVHYNRLWAILAQQSQQGLYVRVRNVFHQSLWTKIGGFTLKVIKPLFTTAAIIGGVVSPPLMLAGLVGTGLADAFTPQPPSQQQVDDFNRGLSTTESPDALKQRYLNTGAWDDTTGIAVLSGYQMRFGDMESPIFCASEVIADIERIIFGGIFLTRLCNGTDWAVFNALRVAPGFFLDPQLFVNYYLGFMVDSSRVLGPVCSTACRAGGSRGARLGQSYLANALQSSDTGATAEDNKVKLILDIFGLAPAPDSAGALAAQVRGWLVPPLARTNSWVRPVLGGQPKRSSGYAPWLMWSMGPQSAGGVNRTALNGTNAFLLPPNFISKQERLITFQILEQRYSSIDWRTLAGTRTEAGVYAPDVFETAAHPFWPTDDSRAKPRLHYLQPENFSGFGADNGSGASTDTGSGGVFDQGPDGQGDSLIPSAVSVLTAAQRAAEAQRIAQQQIAALAGTDPADGYPLGKRTRTMRDHPLFHRDGEVLPPPDLQNPLVRIRWLNENRQAREQMELEGSAPKYARVASLPFAALLQSPALLAEMNTARERVLSHFRPPFVKYDLQRSADERDVVEPFQSRSLDARRLEQLRDAPPNENFAIPLRPFLPRAPNDPAAQAQANARLLSQPFRRAFE